MAVMAIASGACPSCGAPVEFKAGASMSLVCPQCQHVVVRTDRDLESLGKVADVVFNDSSLAHGDGGVFQGRSFVVHGRVVMQHPAGGTWEEYYVLFGAVPSWVEEAMGRWYVVEQVPVTAPPLDGLSPGAPVGLGTYGQFVVDEVSHGTFLSAEGELPFSAAPGTIRRFADLSAPDGARASLQQVDGSEEITVYVGIETTFDALGVTRRSGERAEHKVDLGEIKCPSCGAPLPARKDPNAERFVCKYCGVLADVATHAVIAQQDVSRLSPAIPLGSQGTLDATPFVVIGYVTRATTIEDETFTWEEYLLYNADRGYGWLIHDEGVWRLGFPVAGGEVDVTRYPDSVRHQTKRYSLRNSGSLSVTHVLGEFYWKLSIGETVLGHDFEAGHAILSRESSGSEVNWTLARTVSPGLIESAFGVKLPSTHVFAPSELSGEASGGSFATMNRVMQVTFFFLLLFILIKTDRSCHSGGVATDDDMNSPSGRGAGGAGGGGGFGGK